MSVFEIGQFFQIIVVIFSSETIVCNHFESILSEYKAGILKK